MITCDKPKKNQRPLRLFENENWKVNVRVAVGVGCRRPMYCLTVCRGVYYTYCWYGRNPDRLQRKGERIANRLNRWLQRDRDIAAARGEVDQ